MITVGQAIERIRFATSTPNDLSGKSNSNLFSNANLAQQFKFALDKFASATKIIEDIYSYSLANDIYYVDAPPKALRTRAYRYGAVLLQNRLFPVNISDFNNTLPNYPYTPISGIPTSIVPWGNKLNFYPKLSTSYKTGTLAVGITDSDTTLTLNGPQATSMQPNNGVLTIGDEKIFYGNRTGNVFTHLIRGFELTESSAHSLGDTVSEDNVYLYYYRLHFDITTVNDILDPVVMNMPMEIADEYIEAVCDYTAFKLLSKIDPGRAKAYEFNFDKYIEDTAYKINCGRNDIKKISAIRDPFYFETDLPYSNNAIY